MTAPRPYTMIAELTHRCPLHCPYCSNPVELSREELPAEAWMRAIDDADELGVVQLHLTGGEPLLYRDLEPVIARGRRREMYVSLITSGVPLTRERFAALCKAGLDHVQLSFQDSDPASSDAIAGVPVFDHKLKVSVWVKEAGLPLTINIVLHRGNIDRISQHLALAQWLGADRLELANAQYLGFAHANRGALLPTREQLDRAFETAARARERLLGTMVIAFVKPDHVTGTPRACMDGWARRYIHVTPAGRVLPCHAAECIPGLQFDSIADRPLGEIWQTNDALARFRGHDWMREPCRSCDRKGVDFGGCRCQAFMLAGDAEVADPACARSPHHALVTGASRDTLYTLGRRSP